MKISLQGGAAHSKKTDVLVLGVFQPADEAKEDTRKRKKSLQSQVGELDEGMGGGLVKLADGEGFTGEAGQTFATHTHGALPAARVLLVGLGDLEEAGVDEFRRLGGKAVSYAASVKAKRLAIQVPDIDTMRDEPSVASVAEGALLSTYRFDRHITSEQEQLSVERIDLMDELPRASADEVIARADAVFAGVSLARDLVNECAGILNPAQFAEEARAVGTEAGLKVTVLTEKELQRENMGLMLAVAQAAQPYTPPRLVRLHYKPKGKIRKRVVLVGKGLTFDSGGLDIKPAAGMLEMKIDMSGAAAVLGAMRSIGLLKPEGIEVIGYLGCVENGIGGNAYHPGDVLKSRKGLTVEVNNTDAEGRLVLADVIDYALTKDSPDILIDLATLTGACMVALGPSTAGLFSSDDALAEDISASGQRAGEDFWRLPLNAELGYQLKSAIADTKNTGERWGGAITAALFLQKFVDSRARWAHLDIAGPATMEREHDYVPKGGAGFAVRTLVGIVDPL